MPLPALHLRRKQAIVKMGNGPDGACSGAQGTPCRLAMITAQIQRRNALRFVIARPRRGRGNLGKAVAFSPWLSYYPTVYCEIPTSLRSSE